MARRERKSWRDSCVAQKERLRDPLWWYPFPAVISFALVMLLTGHALLGTNPRMGNPSNVMTFPADAQRDSPVWLSLTPIGNELVVTTGDRRVFSWPLDRSDQAALAPLQSYLKEIVAREVVAASLKKEAFGHQTSAIVAADQRLKYLHLRPLLFAFAEAGISRYSFETLNPVLSSRQHEASR